MSWCNDHERKAKIWTFIFTSFTDNDVTRLSNLPPHFLYTCFAICKDDTGNQYLQGLVRIENRNYKQSVRRSIGDNAIYDIPETNEDVYYIVTTIQFSVSFREFGSAKGSRFEGYLNDMKEFKSTIKEW